MLLPKLFGMLLAFAVLATSILIFVMGGRFQQVEQEAYSGTRRPWWFYLGGMAFAVIYIAALVGFITGADKTWAGWILIVIIPVGAALKGSLIIFNKEGQKKVTAIEGDRAWRKIALTRLLLAPLFAVLAYFA